MSNLETSELLIKNKKFSEGLFFCHLTIEKIMKALVVKHTGTFAPKSHNLIYLCEQANVNVLEHDRIFMSVLMKYQLEGRYPEHYPKIPSYEIVNDYLTKTKILFECLKQML